jgi:hypothetical protein
VPEFQSGVALEWDRWQTGQSDRGRLPLTVDQEQRVGHTRPDDLAGGRYNSFVTAFRKNDPPL